MCGTVRRHSSRHLSLFVLMCATVLCPIPPIARAETSEPEPEGAAALKRLTLEELTKIDVTSAGRKEQEAFKTAAAISVITEEDIRRAGARNIPEMLGLVPGLEDAMFNNGTWNVAARGFDIPTANKIEVFMDGRSLYTPLFGG